MARDGSVFLNCGRAGEGREGAGVNAQGIAERTENGKRIEVLKYSLRMSDIDYGHLIQRNQFVKLVINPLMDATEKALKLDHIPGSETRYTLSLLIESEREVEMQ
jgi:hypothetical protein